mmetsp:Transcript_6483/g.8785  ORF Transcript_6483/g.8785 Transcript_6483/m.8785 type:complete len:184 (+) Transcript_6483:45-596(+)
MGENSTTGKFRAKRPDFRASAKKRKQEKQKEQAKKEGITYQKVKEEKIRRKENGEDSERKFQKQERNLSEDQKLMRALVKLLRQIDDLIEKQQSGVVLDKQQLEKVARKDEVLGKMEEADGIPRLVKSKASPVDEDEEDSEMEEEEVEEKEEVEEEEQKKAKKNKRDSKNNTPKKKVRFSKTK